METENHRMPVQRKERQRMVQGTWIGFHNLLQLGKKDPVKYDASPSTVAQVIYAKYVQAIPLDRQVKDWERAEFPMSKATLCNWILEVDKYYGKVLVDYMHRQLLKCHVLHCDETPVQVNGEENPSKCHMWVFRSGEYEKKQIVIFDYQPSRKGGCASRFLDGYKGYFVSDGYAGYNLAGEDGTTTPPRK